MKSIHTLIPDIYKLVGAKDGWFTPDLVKELGIDVSLKLGAHFSPLPKKATLRLSQMGPKCPKALWHSVHTPSEAEPLPPTAMIKYAYGHLIEAMVIALAKAAGHEVTGEQDEVSVDGILGHRDCVIDGCVVDVKSTNSLSFKKFKDGTLGQSDTFGYLEQLDGYLVGSLEDPLVRVKDKAYDLAVDKTLGHMALYEHKIREQYIRARVADYKKIVGLVSPPACTCGVVKDGESGNFALDTQASYSVFKYCCFPSLRTFLYAGKPRYLTKVARRPAPHIIELDRFGKIIYS